MPVPVDPGDYGSGAPITSAGQNLRAQRLYNALNPASVGLDEANVNASLLKKLGLNDAAQAQVGRGKSIIATTESRTNVAFGTLTTPDRVAGIVLPPDGLLVVLYQATWQESVAQAAAATLFMGATQVQQNGPGGIGAVQAVTNTTVAARDCGLTTYGGGLLSNPIPPFNNPAAGADVTTGQAVNVDGLSTGPCYIFAAPGTYDISVQFKSTSGSVTVKNRHLWVWTIGF